MPEWNRFVRAHLPALHARAERENEIVAELAEELEGVYRDARSGGASHEDAEARAAAHFGDWGALAAQIDAAERAPNARAPLAAGAMQDLRFGARMLFRNPGFAAIAIATLAFAIGGNTAIFTIVNAVALRSLPYPEAGRLMAIETRKAQQPEIEPWTSAPDYYDFRQQSRSFESIAAISPLWNVVMSGEGRAEQLDALYVSANLFPMVGARPALGRTFTANEDTVGKPAAVVVVGYDLWQRLGGREDILGRKLTLDAGVYSVIGVMPAGFRWAGAPIAGTATQVQVWLPLAANPLANTPRSLRFLKLAGRLKPGVTREAARDESRRLIASLAELHPDTDRGYLCDVRPLSEQASGKSRPALLLLLATVGFVLLLACANVANLLLARAAARQSEMAVRMAVGASGYRLVRQLIVEAFVLAVAAGALGLGLAYGLLRILIVSGPEALLRAQPIALDGPALAITSAAVLVCALTAGLPPAFRFLTSAPRGGLRASGRGVVSGHRRMRAVLVAAQVALALVLLVGAGLLVRSFRNLMAVDPGLDARNLVTIATQMPNSARTPEARAALWRRIRERLAAVPGVVSAAAVSRLPFSGSNLGSLVFIEGHSLPGQPLSDVEYRVATPEYFATMRIPLRAGRIFDEHDGAGPVALVSETMARKFWPGEDPVGRRIKLNSTGANAPWLTVIGVVGDVRHFGLEAEPRPEVYRSYAVNPLGAPILAVRATRASPEMVKTLAAAIRGVDSEIATYSEFPMETLVERSTVQRRFVMTLLAGFACAALLLAAVGIYGTIAQTVAQRTQEIGVRIALGATPESVVRMVFREGIRLTAAGMAIGWVVSAGLSPWTRSLLFDVRPLDPAAFLVGGAALCGSAMLACYLPARRAARVDPVISLRNLE